MIVQGFAIEWEALGASNTIRIRAKRVFLTVVKDVRGRDSWWPMRVKLSKSAQCLDLLLCSQSDFDASLACVLEEPNIDMGQCVSDHRVNRSSVDFGE